MNSNNNQQFLDTIESHSAFSKIITKSITIPRNQDSLIFRRGDFWYKFENWNPPSSGILREWKSTDEDWTPKLSYTSKLSENQSQIILNIANLSAKFNGCKIWHVSVSNKGKLLLLIVEKQGNYDAVVLRKRSMSALHYIHNISLESSFFFGEEGFIFCRTDKDFRPSKLYYRNFRTDSDELLYVETNVAYRIKIMTEGADSNSCLVKSMDFQKGSLFLYMFEEKKLCNYIIIQDAILPRYYDLMAVEDSTYFLYIKQQKGCKRKKITFREFKNDEMFEVELKSTKLISDLRCIGKNILLDISSQSQYSYLLLRLKSSLFPTMFEEVEIEFQKKTLIYENSFADNLILFSQKELFAETILSYEVTKKILKTEFSIPVFLDNSSDKYRYKTIWTEKDHSGVCIPISILWKSEISNELPRGKSCVVNVYGAYGQDDSIKPDPFIISMIEAGFVYATVHVRGGGFLGGEWYRAGKGMNKWNSIEDLITGVNYLIKQKIADKNHLGLMTSSAGGIVAGAALNEHNNMFKSLLLFSPFIDPYSSLLKGEDPLSKTEILEWGDVTNPDVKAYIKSYSPMQNIDKAKGSQSTVISLIGGMDPYINNDDVILWSNELRKRGIHSLIYFNSNAGHSGLGNEDTNLTINVLNYFLEQIEN